MIYQPKDDLGGPVFEAARVVDLGVGRAAADFAYSVRPAAQNADRRSARRRRTRLRSGKILDLGNGFIIECQIYDRSEKGVRVRLLADIPARPVIRLYEDDPERLCDARIVWRKDFELGLCFIRRYGAHKISRTQLTCLRWPLLRDRRLGCASCWRSHGAASVIMPFSVNTTHRPLRFWIERMRPRSGSTTPGAAA